MNIHEYQARQLLGQYGVAMPRWEVCSTAEAAKSIAAKLLAEGADLIAVKSQIHAGGRGKGTFKSGFQGGVKLCKTAEDVGAKAKAMLGNVLVTKQTGPEGRRVSKLIIAAAPEIKKELYLAVLLDRAASRPVVMASTEGGMDIEEVAARTPEKILKESIDPAVGVILEVKVGQKVDAGGVLCRLYYTGDERVEEAAQLVEDAFRISSTPPEERELILEVVG